jgi:flagellar hook-basal body complex protein FliE
VPIPAIAPIPPLPNLPATAPVADPNAASGAAGGAGASASGGADFSNVLGNLVDSLNQAQNTASVAEAQAATGQGSLTDTMIAASQASLDTEVANSVIDKALAAYNSVASMPV